MSKSAAKQRLHDQLQDILAEAIPQKKDDESTETFIDRVVKEKQAKNPKLSLEYMITYRLAMKAATGGDTAIREVFDRLVGKPTQTNENLNVAATYLDFLDDCPLPPEIPVLEVEPDLKALGFE